MGCNSVESDFFQFGDISPLKEVVVNRGGVEVVRNSVNENKLTSKSSILNFFEKSIVESGNVGSGLIFDGGFTAISISRLVTKHNV